MPNPVLLEFQSNLLKKNLPLGEPKGGLIDDCTGFWVPYKLKKCYCNTMKDHPRFRILNSNSFDCFNIYSYQAIIQKLLLPCCQFVYDHPPDPHFLH